MSVISTDMTCTPNCFIEFATCSQSKMSALSGDDPFLCAPTLKVSFPLLATHNLRRELLGSDVTKSGFHPQRKKEIKKKEKQEQQSDAAYIGVYIYK